MNIELSARRLTAALFAMLLIGGLCGRANAQTAVSACGSLSAPGNYFLTGNLSATGDCLVIAADNVAIDMKGKTITGNGTGAGITDAASTHDFAIIANGKIRNFNTGIDLEQSGKSIISNIDSSKNTGDGIFIFFCCNTLNAVTTNGNGGVGIEMDSEDSSLSNIQANGNAGGGIFNGECCNTLVGSTVNNNGGVGVQMGGGRSFVVGSKIQKNSDIGLEMTDGDNGVIKSTTSKNSGDGMELGGGDNMIVASKSNGNGGTGVDLGTNTWGIFSGVQANKNASDGVDMGCRGSTASLKAQKNSGTNLVQTNVNGPCANVNLKAP
jgi:Right handed beta helix region